MSIWSEASGTVCIEDLLKSKFSLKKYTKSLNPELILHLEQASIDSYNFTLIIPGSGGSANDLLRAWFDGVPGRVDMVSHVRYLK